MRRLLAHTIWGNGRVDHVPDRYRTLVLFAYPVLYGLNVVAYGIVGTITGGSVILQKAIPTPGANILCGIIGAAALIAFIGVATGGGNNTRRGQKIERLGAIAMTPPTIAYLVLLLVALGGGNNQPLAAITGTGLVLMFTLLRSLDLSTQIGDSTATTGR